MFKNLVRLGPNNEISEIFDSLGFIIQINKHKYENGTTGYAWASTRWALEKTKGLTDVNIVGSGDSFIAHSLLNKADHWISHFLRFKTNYLNTDNYANLLRKKQMLFEKNNLKFVFNIKNNAKCNKSVVVLMYLYK